MKSRRTGLGMAAIGMASAVAVAAFMRGVQPAFPSNEPRLKVPASKALTPRQQRNLDNEWGRDANRQKRAQMLRERPTSERRFVALVNKMTNHQRCQWSRAGYPGLQNKDPKKLAPYAAAEKREAA